MPRCVTTKKLAELTKHEDPDVAAVAQELVRARKKLASYRDSAPKSRKPLLEVEELLEGFHL